LVYSKGKTESFWQKDQKELKRLAFFIFRPLSGK